MSLLFARGVAALVLLVPALASAQVVLTSSGASEDFDGLANTGTTGSVLPVGWFLLETGGNANTTYGVGDGASNTGNSWSFGTGSNTDRALGGLRSSNLVPVFGAQISNETGGTLSELPIAYVGEQWRMGTAGREDRLDFQYSLDATSLNTGIWVDVDTLDFIAPVQSGVARGLDGNLAANSTLTGTRTLRLPQLRPATISIIAAATTASK